MKWLKEKIATNPVWVSFLYFGEGLPFTFLRSSVVPAFLTKMGASLEVVGLTSLLGIPYTFKFIWSPIIDIFWRKRHWTVALQLSLVVMLVFLSFIIAIPYAMTLWWTGFAISAFLSASQDIAIDGFYMEALDDEGQAAFAGLRIAAYRVSMILGTSIPLMIAGKVNWFWGFLSCSALLGIVLIYNFFFLPRPAAAPPKPSNPSNKALTTVQEDPRGVKDTLHDAVALLLPVAIVVGWKFHYIKSEYFKPGIAIASLYLLSRIFLWLKGSLRLDPTSSPVKARLVAHVQSYMEAFRSYLDQDRIGLVLVFMLIFKLGDAMLFSMNTPFLLRGLGITEFQLGWISGTVGKISSIAGSIFGGWYVARKGLRKGLWELALVMNAAILAYVWLAVAKPGLWGVVAVHALEQIAAGVGATAFAIFQMRTCKKEYRAAHFAIATSIIAFGPMISGPIGGHLASRLGYASFFWVCFGVSIPGLVLVKFLPIKEEGHPRKG
jgi:PAT family beta-lactamase induction signal transducer AmpG